MNRIATLVLLLIACRTLSAQLDRFPLDYQPQQWQPAQHTLPKGATDALQKDHCDPAEQDKLYVEAGQMLVIPIDLDTFDLFAEGGRFQCANCELAQFGDARLSATGDSLLFTANSDVIIGEDAFDIRFCSVNDPNDCRLNTVIRVVSRRTGRHYFPPALSVRPGSVSEVIADANLLPGQLTCNYFVDCPDNYDGRDQISYFSTYREADNRIIYQASRFSGVDSLCVGICDEFAICDTFHFAFSVTDTVLRLPFFDDFSYSGPGTNPNLWLDSEVFVNQTMAEQPPSFGVATMDGVNSRGRPYGGDPGPADRLTSQPINLQGEIGNVVLTYWVQRRGLGDKPESGDSLRLEFRTTNGSWRNVESLPGIPPEQPSTVAEPFRFYATPVPAAFRHSRFQFRFVNYADRLGVRDNWHLDYIRLSTEETDSIFADVAFTEPPEPILRDYTAMPWRHFRNLDESVLSDEIRVGIFNHFDEPVSVIPSLVTLVEETSGVSPFGSALTLFNGQEANIPNGMPVERVYSLVNDPTGFAAIWPTYVDAMFGPGFPDDADLRFRLTYELVNNSQIQDPGYECVERNDRVSSLTIFDNYFAYDDGTAEQGLVAQEGTQVAMEFRAGLPDTLRAVRIMHPRSNADVSDQEFELLVWLGTLDDTPDYRMTLTPFFADINFDTIQGFTTYVLQDEEGNPMPLGIPAGNFYVGWNQLSDCTFNRCVPVGYDRNRPQGADFTFVNVGQGWKLIDETERGSLMIRPVVGSETPPATDVRESLVVQDFVDVFPNPSRGTLYLRPEGGRFAERQYALYSQTGQLLQQGALHPELSLQDLPSGMYLLQIIDRREGTRQLSKLSLIK